MKIAILGAGAMGMLFGGCLSLHNDVTLVEVNPARVQEINAEGVCVCEPDGTQRQCRPRAVADTSGMAPVDLVIVFVKAMYSRAALEANKALIGPDTYLMTLQNGSGHEEVLREFAPDERVVIGTTQHNSSIAGPHAVHHGGGGHTFIGPLAGDPARLALVAQTFTACGFDTETAENVQKLIWNKMFLNVSASALTAILQVKLGYMVDNAHAWTLTERLIREAVAVANGDGLGFDADAVVAEIHGRLEQSKEGCTSIYADLRDGRRTEVDTISGSVVRASRRNGVPAPNHAFVVELIHAMEERA